MATDRPEYFYHPAVGVISPASLELFRLNAGKTPEAAKIILAQPPVGLPVHPLPAVNVDHLAPILPADTLMTNPALPARPSRRAMTLSRTAVCVVTGEDLPMQDMIRFVITPQNEVMADLAEKLPGEGFYIKADLATLKKALWRNTFTSIAKDNVTVPDNLIASIEKGLSKLALETLSMARRAGQLVMGFAKVEEELRTKASGIYVVANDASDHGRLKLAKLARDLQVLDIWTSEELSVALGEANTNHILVGPGGLSEKLSRLAKKLTAIRTDLK